jgi:hypothetical protein
MRRNTSPRLLCFAELNRAVRYRALSCPALPALLGLASHIRSSRHYASPRLQYVYGLKHIGQFSQRFILEPERL